MEPIKSTRQDLVGSNFCILVAQTAFAPRYYKLCDKYPFWVGGPYSCSKKDVFEILSEIGRTSKFDHRDKSYSFDLVVDRWSAGCCFVLQQSTVEFMFSATRDNQRVGSNFAVVAYAVTELGDPEKAKKIRFPRVHFSSRESLKEILRECFDLSELLASALMKMPPPNANIL